MAESNHEENLSCSALIELGFGALREEDWDRALELFDRVLRQEPSSGFGCLGRAMAVNRIPEPRELAAHWDSLSQQTAFQEMLSPAEPDFLSWLRSEMERMRTLPDQSAEDAAAQPEEDSVPGGFSPGDLMPDFSAMSPGRKLLLGFASLQVLLYLAVALCFWLSDPYAASPGVAIPGSLFLAAVFCGAPVILGPVYGNSIVEAGRFETLLKILNIIVGLLGCFITAILTVAFYASWQEGGPSGHGEGMTCLGYALCFVTYLSSLIFPKILDRVEYG